MPPKIFTFDEFLISRIPIVSTGRPGLQLCELWIFQGEEEVGEEGGEGGHFWPAQFNWPGLIDNARKQTSCSVWEQSRGPQTTQHEYCCLARWQWGLYMDQMRVNMYGGVCERRPLYTAPSPVTRSTNRPTRIIRTSNIQIGSHQSACSAVLTQ